VAFRPIPAGTVILLGACVGTPAAKSSERWQDILRLECLVPAKRHACDPSLRLAFHVPPNTLDPFGKATLEAKDGAMWCEAGRPRGRFVGLLRKPHDAIVGDFGEAVWEAIWRVVDAKASCVSMFGTPVEVTRGRVSQACAAPTWGIDSLVYTAADWVARRRPIFVPREYATVGACSIDPSWYACIARSPDVCPPFEGDYEAPSEP
jgi:hypothetical protein